MAPPPGLGVRSTSTSKDDDDADASSNRSQRHLRALLDEIVNTERDYVESLDALIESFLVPMKAAEMLSADKIQAMFQNIEVLVGVNRQLLARIVAMPQPIEPEPLASCFLDIAPMLRMYADYCSVNAAAMDTLRKALQKKDSPFVAFHEEARHADARLRSLGLEDLLLKPVQRLCKYPLLFRELLKKMDDLEAADGGGGQMAAARERVAAALVALQDVATHVNERKRLFEEHRKIVRIQRSVDGLGNVVLVTAKRRLLHEGPMAMNDPASERYVFLFKDLIVIVKRKKIPTGKKKYDVGKLFFLDDFVTFNSVDDSTVLKSAIEVVDSNGRMPTVDTLLAPSAQQKLEWIEHMRSTAAAFTDGDTGLLSAAIDFAASSSRGGVGTGGALGGKQRRSRHKTKGGGNYASADAASISAAYAQPADFDINSLHQRLVEKQQRQSMIDESSSPSSSSTAATTPAPAPRSQLRRHARNRSSSMTTAADIAQQQLQSQLAENDAARERIASIERQCIELRERIERTRQAHGPPCDQFISSLRVEYQLRRQ
jgi:RhoGEF domain/SOS1/NGEF-like PH domain